MSYQILRTDKADEQLRDIIFYIADDSGSVDIALNYLEKIEKAINKLKVNPYSGSVPHYATLRRQGYRVLIVERHLVFYKVNESQQSVNHLRCCGWLNILVRAPDYSDGRREYRNLL